MENGVKESGGMRVQAPVCEKQIVTELSADFSLPDYQPPVKRLLRVTATAQPADKFIGAGTVDFSGNMDYSVLYLGEDGGLYCTSQAGDYQFSVPVEIPSDFEIGDGFLCYAENTPEGVSGRVLAPRRISVRCRLRSGVHLFGTMVPEEAVTGTQEEALQRLRKSVECVRLFYGIGTPFSLADEILPEAPSENLRVVCANAEVLMTEATAGSGCVNCRGEVCLKLLYCRDGSGELPGTVLRRIPFSQSVPVDGAAVNCDSVARGTCTGINITVEEGRILCEVTVVPEAWARKNETVPYTRDLYSTAADGEMQYADYTFRRALKSGVGNFSLNQTLTLEEAGIRPGASVVDVMLSPSVTATETEKGKLILSGKCRCHVVYTCEEDMGAQEFEIPFRYGTDGGGEELAGCDAQILPITCRARVDGERIAVDAELAVTLATYGNSQATVLHSARFGEELPAGDGGYTICYPSREDTLWTVSKRYHRSVAEVAGMNPLSGSPAADAPDSLSGVQYLLV